MKKALLFGVPEGIRIPGLPLRRTTNHLRVLFRSAPKSLDLAGFFTGPSPFVCAEFRSVVRKFGVHFRRFLEISKKGK